MSYIENRSYERFEKILDSKRALFKYGESIDFVPLDAEYYVSIA